MSKKIYKILSLLLCFCLVFEQAGFAQSIGQLDISGYLTSLRNNITQDKFRPLHLRYLSYDALNNNFSLLVDKGNNSVIEKADLEEATKSLMNYFLVGLSLPNESFWVNLRPDAETNIIDDKLAKTDIGKIMLEADVQLKKDTARYTSPNTPEGKEYWDKLYKKTGEIFGYDNIQIPTLTRPWIVPDEILAAETKDGVYIFKATLKVMLEQDYLKDSAVYNFNDERLKALNEYSSQLIRELIIPKITQEVNSSKRYAPLRQVYYSLILSQWFKTRFSSKEDFYASLIDRHNLSSLTSKILWSKTAYFEEYQKSFKNGEYNTSQLVYTPYGQTIRSYFSGGIKLASSSSLKSVFPGDVIPDNPNLLSCNYDGNTGTMRTVASSSPIIPLNSEELFDAEPQLKQDNPYGMALRRLLTGSGVTPESIKRRRILNKIGPEAERYAQALYGNNPNIKIVITPYGRTLKGYADEESDLEYAIYIISGAEEEPALDRGVRRIRIHEEINSLINNQQERVKAEDMIAVLPIMNLSGITSGDVRVSLLESELDAWYLMHLFLPVEYGNGSLIEQCRKNIITYFSRKGQEGQEAWKSIQRVYAEYVAIREGDVSLKPHLRNWLARQGVTSLEDFNKARAVGLPDLTEMIRIYGVLETVSHQDTPSFTSSQSKLSLVDSVEAAWKIVKNTPKVNFDPIVFSQSQGTMYRGIIGEKALNDVIQARTIRPWYIGGETNWTPFPKDAYGYATKRRASQLGMIFEIPFKVAYKYGLGGGIYSTDQPISTEEISRVWVLTGDSESDINKRLVYIAEVRLPGMSSVASSPTQPASDTKGGIDFRTLHIITQAMSNLRATTGIIPNINLSLEWQDIEQLVQSGITPSGERMKEYLQTSCYNGRIMQDKKKVISCISDILRLQEEQCASTEPVLRDILVVLESSRSVEELRTVFIGLKP